MTKDTEAPQSALDVAVQVVEAQKGSLLDELGQARDAVNIIVTIVGTAAEASFFAFPSLTLSDNMFLL